MTTTAEAVRSAVGAFDVEVVRAVRLSPTFRRITFGGPSLHEFLDHGPLGPRDLRVKLILPVAGSRPCDVGDLSEGWYQRWRALDPTVRGVMRTFTVRRARLAGPDPQIDIDFALHGAVGSGPASAWASAARPRDRLTLIGPSAGAAGVAGAIVAAGAAGAAGAIDPAASADGYGGIEWRPPRPVPEHPTRVLLVGDETAVPAVCSILETMPAGYAGHAVLEVPTPEDFQDVRSSSSLEVRWLARGGRARGELVDDAVRELLCDGPATGMRDNAPGVRDGMPGVSDTVAGVRDRAPVVREGTATGASAAADDEVLWESPAGVASSWTGGPYAWVAGEAGMVRSVRRLLVGEAGFDRARVAFMGYWRQGRAEGA